MYNDDYDHKRNDFQRMQPVGNLTTSLELHWEVTKDLINEWSKQKAYERMLDKNGYKPAKYFELAVAILHKFYREPWSKEDPTWGVYDEFWAIWPDRIPLGKGLTLRKLIREVLQTFKKVTFSDYREVVKGAK